LIGRDYLVIFFQIALDLPSIPASVLQREVFANIDAALDGIEDRGPFDEKIWPDIFVEIVRPLIKSMRDIRRYAVAVRWTVSALNGRISLPDVLGLEAIRTFTPDLFGQLHSAVDALTSTTNLGLESGGIPDPNKEVITRLLRINESHEQIVRSMISRLFPAAARYIGGTTYLFDIKVRWLRDKRVAHEDILRLYLERVVGESLQIADESAHAAKLMANADEFENYLRSVPAERLEDVISGLETFEDEFAPEQVVPATVVLLNLLTLIPERQRGMFEFDSRLTVGRVVFRLLRSLEDASAVERAVRLIVPRLNTLSAKLEVVTDVGYREGAGHRLVSEETASQLEKGWRDDVRSASAEDLTKEKDLLWVLFRATKDRQDGESPLLIPDSPEVTLALLRSAKSEVRSQGVEARAIRRSHRLQWDALVELYGSDSTLAERISKVPRTDQDVELFELVDKYLTGWRPKN
jgi:hypothetical protein